MGLGIIQLEKRLGPVTLAATPFVSFLAKTLLHLSETTDRYVCT